MALLLVLAAGCDNSTSGTAEKESTTANSMLARFSVEQSAWIPDSVRYLFAGDSGMLKPTILDKSLFEVRIPAGVGENDTLELQFLFRGVLGAKYLLRRFGATLAPYERRQVESVRRALLALDSLSRFDPSRFPNDRSGLIKSWAWGLAKGVQGFGRFPDDEPEEFDSDVVWRDVFYWLLDEGATVPGRIGVWGMPRDTEVVRASANRLREEGVLTAVQVRTLFADSGAQGVDRLPTISLVSPTSPSLQVESGQDSLRVRVVAIDQDGIAGVKIGEIEAKWIGENLFEATVSLPEPGKSTSLRISARDSSGQEASRFLAVERKAEGAAPDTIVPRLRLLVDLDSVVGHSVDSARIRWLATDEGGITLVRLDSQSISPTDGDLYESSVRLREGVNRVAFHLEDASGNAFDSVLVIRREEGPPPDTVAPRFLLLMEFDSVVVHEKDRILVRWLVSDRGGLQVVQLDSQSVSPFDSGLYEQWVPLSEGVNRLVFHAEDLAGNGLDTVLRVRRRGPPPGEVESSVLPGVYRRPFFVNFQTRDPVDAIRYELGTDEPDSSSAILGDSLRIDSTVTMSLRAWADGVPGPVTRFRWQLVADEVRLSDTGTQERSEPFRIRASCSTPGAVIRYSRNGPAPDSTSPVWSDSLWIDSTSTFRFRAFAPGFEMGGVREIRYQVAYVVDIAMGNSNTLFLKSDGTLWSSGSALEAGFGGESGGVVLRPLKLMDSVLTMDAGAAIRKDGSLWRWQSHTAGGFKPQEWTVCTQNGGATRVRTSPGNQMVLCSDGTLWAWGDNSSGSLGTGDDSPQTLPSLVLENVIDFAVGPAHTLAIREDHSIWAWGSNESGQLGLGDTDVRMVPTKVEVPKMSWVQTSADNQTSLLLASDGSLFSMGSNYRSMAGMGDDSGIARFPTQIFAEVAQMDIGAFHGLAVTVDGVVWSWGFNQRGELGDGSPFDRQVPVRIFAEAEKVVAGYQNSLILRKDGTVWGMGYNSSGNLGSGDATSFIVPTRIRF